jgi:hypothetical protein
MCANVWKCHNDASWNYSRNQERGRWKRIIKRVNSNMIYLIHYKNFCKCHNIPPPSTAKKEKIKIKINKPFILLYLFQLHWKSGSMIIFKKWNIFKWSRNTLHTKHIINVCTYKYICTIHDYMYMCVCMCMCIIFT